ncbi:hypothetical protein [Prescottella subtropica]|uniref:hypothetical protein n=1 Tax=Prescottella subtropica TaxID=2545757 RepID=UPI0010F62277|nr:hypothetical protein [Prescottella subtropica]
MTFSDDTFLVQQMAAEFATFLGHYIEWHDRYTAAEAAAARAAVKAAGGRVITGGGGPWVDGQCTETYYDDETGKKLGVIVWRNGDMSVPALCTMQFREADVHVDHLVDEDVELFEGPDPFGFTMWADEQDIDELRAQLPRSSDRFRPL